MAYEIPGKQLTYTAGVDLSGSQYRAVDLNSSKLAVLPALGARVFGVVQNKPASGQPATVMIDGVTKMIAGGAITAGDKISAMADGRAKTAVATEFVLGRAELAAAGAGIVISVLLDQQGVL